LKNSIIEAISSASLEQILDTNNLDKLECTWVNQEIFSDIIYNLKLNVDDDQLDKVLKDISTREVFDALIKSFRKQNYMVMNQHLFSFAEKGFKPTKDIETLIFVKEDLYRKLLIKLMNEYSWILKAMALDTFFKMGTDYSSLKETYRDLYEDNSRIIETLLSNEEHRFLTGYWILERKTKELKFYKAEEFYQSWGEGEANSRFEEHIK